MKVSSEQFTKFKEGCGECIRDFEKRLKKDLPISYKRISDFLRVM